ncbi:Uncharacterized protein TPAR_00958 [Tolypocladium paradoxum]|uniref:Phospholipase/carboxylesterase/thioesterase domain-containing protein n=1 Tax=Tolypocladium paradoxum TaxID=94208 RepID=A0A2S4L8R7_9HYPO|nr:Uncharacterized protein TPAR_00958 [Tolypocladium paradoxum]
MTQPPSNTATNAEDPTAFGETHIIHPKRRHTHTLVFLHGRGSTGRELAAELASTRMSDRRNLQQALTGYRLVFPTARGVWSHTFSEYTPAWLETFFFARHVDKHAVVSAGIASAVEYLTGLVRAEIELLGGRPHRVILAGISEGASVGMWTLFCQGLRLGGFIGINTTLPFAPSIQRQLNSGCPSRPGGRSAEEHRRQNVFVNTMLAPVKEKLGRGSTLSLLQTPVLLTHGVDDAFVDAELGREACDTLNIMGFRPSWIEYVGADEYGHWIKEPEGVDDLYDFITSVE